MFILVGQVQHGFDGAGRGYNLEALAGKRGFVEKAQVVVIFHDQHSCHGGVGLRVWASYE